MTNWMPSQRQRRFLVIEDESDISQLISLHLSQDDTQVVCSNTGTDGLRKAKEGSWDLIILDLQLPGMDGLDICRYLRSQSQYVPILMLTSRSSELDRVLGLELGADDYLTKPFSLIELQARIKAVLRRTEQPLTDNESSTQNQIAVDKLFLDKEKRQVLLDQKNIELTAKEFDLLWFFASNQGKVFSRSELLDKIWGYGHDGYEHTVNSHINRLRSKIEPSPTQPHFIHTVWGVGYRFMD